jgi:hypothetical protein
VTDGYFNFITFNLEGNDDREKSEGEVKQVVFFISTNKV